ncbi:Proteoglycan-4 [Curvularia kusanoi]|uniref:Proteoglycan-4 n=1 Tax=Curvularia kusanoi TaxID=90978 RepID=A0A9P4T3P1_CURKU|nr:Proteoglycan-4 [Curvularia kusanoi]
MEHPIEDLFDISNSFVPEHPIDDLFDISEFLHDNQDVTEGQDVQLVADNHLFNNGSDLFGNPGLSLFDNGPELFDNPGIPNVQYLDPTMNPTTAAAQDIPLQSIEGDKSRQAVDSVQNTNVVISQYPNTDMPQNMNVGVSQNINTGVKDNLNWADPQNMNLAMPQNTNFVMPQFMNPAMPQNMNFGTSQGFNFNMTGNNNMQMFNAGFDLLAQNSGEVGLGINFAPQPFNVQTVPGAVVDPALTVNQAPRSLASAGRKSISAANLEVGQLQQQQQQQQQPLWVIPDDGSAQLWQPMQNMQHIQNFQPVQNTQNAQPMQFTQPTQNKQHMQPVANMLPVQHMQQFQHMQHFQPMQQAQFMQPAQPMLPLQPQSVAPDGQSGSPLDPLIMPTFQQQEQQPLLLQAPLQIEQSAPGLGPASSRQQIQGPTGKDASITAENVQMLQNAEPSRRKLSIQIPSRPESRAADDEAESSPELPRRHKPNRKSRSKQRNHSKGPSEQRVLVSTSSDTPITGLSFTSYDDAKVAMKSRFMHKDFVPPHPDHTIPRTYVERSNYVLKLFNAFQDTSACKDTKGGHIFRKRWADLDFYNAQEIEKVCWHMLDIAERLHTEGPVSLDCHDEETERKVWCSRDYTFEERIDNICHLLRYTKHSCDTLMKGDNFISVVGAPLSKTSGAKTMVKQNNKRQKWIRNGREGDPNYTQLEVVNDYDENDTEEEMATSDETMPASRGRPRGTLKCQAKAIPKVQTPVPVEDSDLQRRQTPLLLAGESSSVSGTTFTTPIPDSPIDPVLASKPSQPVRASRVPISHAGTEEGRALPKEPENTNAVTKTKVATKTTTKASNEPQQPLKPTEATTTNSSKRKHPMVIDPDSDSEDDEPLPKRPRKSSPKVVIPAKKVVSDDALVVEEPEKTAPEKSSTATESKKAAPKPAKSSPAPEPTESSPAPESKKRKSHVMSEPKPLRRSKRSKTTASETPAPPAPSTPAKKGKTTGKTGVGRNSKGRFAKKVIEEPEESEDESELSEAESELSDVPDVIEEPEDMPPARSTRSATKKSNARH